MDIGKSSRSVETIFRKTIQKHPETTLHNDGKSTLKLMISYMTIPSYTLKISSLSHLLKIQKLLSLDITSLKVKLVTV